MRARARAAAAVSAVAVFTTAALLFLLEPMVGKLTLPLLGSTPEVWNATILFFQAALLAGYAWSDWSTRRLRRPLQAALQLALMATAAVVLPISVHGGPPVHSDPVWWLLGALGIGAGLPFFALAATGPMLQRWASGVLDNPYVLFAASNGGSLIGLLAYPLLVERLFTLGGQSRLWSVGYGVAFALVAASALALLRRPLPAAPAEVSGGSVGASRRLRWLALAAVPSSLMLGTTTYITRDLAPVPLLWVLPLAIYLLAFVAAFAPGVRPQRLAAYTRVALPGVTILLAYTLAIGSQRPLWLLLPLHLTGLAVAALMCHALLAHERPPPHRLTEFYLCVAAGGALGGVFNAIVAPVVFPTLVEYPLAIVAACLLRPAPPRRRPALLEFLLRDPRPTRAMDLVAPAALGGALAAVLAILSHSRGGLAFGPRSAIVGVTCGLALNLSKRPLRFALAIGAVLLAASLAGPSIGHVLERERSFFGIYKVVAQGDGYHALYDGTTLHGLERVGLPEPLSYYGRPGPAGQAFAELPSADTRRVALIGLGAGALACYAKPGARFTFYEVDPAVARIARDRRLFSYLSGCGNPRVVLGDGRRSVARAPARSFGLLVVDAFNSDAIPIHLVTREALRLYRSRLTATGATLFHISNRYLDLEPVLGRLAGDARLECVVERHVPTPAQGAAGLSLSQWALIAPAGGLGAVAGDRRWRRCRSGGPTWTDGYSNLLSVVKWG